LSNKNNINTKEKILKTSEELFAKKGYDATSVDEISRKAGITKSLIYYYFKSKKEILETLFNLLEKDSLALKESTFGALFANFNKETFELKFKELLMNVAFPFVEKWKNVIKISLIEEIKYFSKGPIFKFFDSNLKTAKDFYSNYDIEINLYEPKTITTFFFSMILPLIDYSVFVEEWCDHYGIKKDSVKEILAENILNNIKHIYKNFTKKENI